MAKTENNKSEKKLKSGISKTESTSPKAKKSETASKSKATTKKTTSKKVATKKSTTKKVSGSRKKAVANIIEYYDLPAFYNKTTVRLLFQTPKKLFVYWEISEADKKNLFKDNGNDFFETTTPFLVVKNKTKNYSFEVEINDYANSWYFDVPDSNCEYEVELIRKHIKNNTTILITSSNGLEVPNNTILFEQDRKEIFFKNVKTDDVSSKSVVNLQFINHLSNVSNANSFYKKFYDEEDLISLNNPSS